MNEKHFNAFYLMKLFEELELDTQYQLMGEIEGILHTQFKKKCLEEYSMRLVHYPPEMMIRTH